MPTDPVPPDDRTVTVAPPGPETITAGGGSTPSPLLTGRRFGDYELLDELARGGMGVVYKARQVSANRIVALKMILSGRYASATDVQRFRQEAEAAANLDHPNILPVYDVGEVEGQSYFTMKLVEGGSLADHVRRLAADPGAAAAVMEQVARGVHYAHQRGVLHRDLKPSNILLADPATPVIADFGLAKKVEADSSLTQSGAILGTPSYMAPEQACGSKEITTVADTYSLGAILYELLTGQPPFKGASVAQTLRMVEEQDPIPPRKLNPKCDPDLESIVLRCLEKDPGRRYGTAGALADDLAAWRRGEAVTARRAGPGRRAWKWVRRNPTVAGLSAAVALALLAGSITSAVYAARADRRAKEAAANEQAAREQEQTVRNREEVLKDVLCLTNYQQARAVRLAGQPGWRSWALDLLKNAAELRRRPRDTANPDDQTVDLPDPADLRGEAIMALIAHDAQMVREIPLNIGSFPHYSPDGTRLLHVQMGITGPSELRITDLTTGREVHRLQPQVDIEADLFSPFHLRALGPGGTQVAHVSNAPPGSIDVRDLPSTRLVARFKAPVGKDLYAAVSRVQFSPDGRRLAAVRLSKSEAEAVVWDLARPDDPRVLAREPAGGGGLNSGLFPGLDLGPFPGLRFSPNGNRVSFATPDRKAVRIVDLTADPDAKPLDVPVRGELVTLEWHPRDPVLALAVAKTGEPAGVVLWDLAAGKALATCQRDPDRAGEGMVSMAFNPDGRWLAVGGANPTIRVYGARDGAERFRLTDVVAFGVHQVRWTPTGELIVAGLMETLRVWKPDPDPLADVLHGLRPAGRPAFGPGGRWLAVFAPTADRRVNRVAADLMEKVGARPNLDRVALIDRQTGRVERRLPGVSAAQGRLHFAPDGRRLIVEQADEVVVREVETGDELLRRVPPKGARKTPWILTTFLPDGRPVGIAATPARAKLGSGLMVRDLATGGELYAVEGKATGSLAFEAAVSPDGRWLYADLAEVAPDSGQPARIIRTGRLYDLPTGGLVAEVPARAEAVGRMANTARVSTGGTRALSLHMTTTGPDALLTNAYWAVRAVPSGEELLRVPNRSMMADFAHDFSPDGRLVALGSDRGQVEVWDVDAKALLLRFQPHGGRTVHALAFAPNGDLATTSDDDDRLVVVRMREVRDRLTEIGLGW
jgi:WD40 repeat protein/tRNA A-37 threonylcarbamoyl transferase component Bud32